jgi:transcriptional regulator GlxA family with amidase domain
MTYKIEIVISLMRDNLHRDLPLDEMARAISLSPEHLCRVFRAETGVSPVQYLKSLRMERARSLLETTFLSVKEVMARVGVGDVSHFARDFRRAFGCSPAQYRAVYFSSTRAAPARTILKINIGQ